MDGNPTTRDLGKGRGINLNCIWPLLKRVHPTCTERQSLNKECGWKGGDRGGLAQWEQFGKRRNKEEERKKRETMKEKA